MKQLGLIIIIIITSCTQNLEKQIDLNEFPKEWIRLTEKDGEMIIFNSCDAGNLHLSIDKDNLLLHGQQEDSELTILKSTTLNDTAILQCKWNNSDEIQNFKFIWVKKEEGIGQWITTFSSGWTSDFYFILADKKDEIKIIDQPCRECWGDECDESNIIQIKCDSIYPNKKYEINLIPIELADENKTKYDFIFVLTNKVNKTTIEVYRDTIYSRVQEISFKDFNNDGVKDILIQNISDVRSNWTHNLYLTDLKENRLKKVKGFNKIKNPNYLPEYNLIDNYVNSGKNWTSFYKIQNDSIINCDIVVYDKQLDDNTYEEEHKRAIERISNAL